MSMREWARHALPRSGPRRLLLAAGAAALFALIPLLWIWLRYSSGLVGAELWIWGVGLCLLIAAIGAAMIRLLDDER